MDERRVDGVAFAPPSLAGQLSVSFATDRRTGIPVSAVPAAGLWKQTLQSAAVAAERFAPVASVTLTLPKPAPDAAARAAARVCPLRLRTR
ncbi:hypothetical protein [Streptomyces sp. IBSBF 2435]|uniref:hypothetical protein n=1 Tax=Streptomyces sp. IBSBF 2435 TaxID=2903531 RepID=UPI002FDBAAB0